MKSVRLPMISLALFTSALAGACATEQVETSPAAEADVQVTSELKALPARSINAIDVVGLPPDPPPPPPPPPDCKQPGPPEKVIRITSDQLDGSLKLVLGGTRIAFDTTGTSVPHPGGDPIHVCTYPNQEARAAAIAECLAGPPSNKGACLAQVNEDLPNISECYTTVASYHSYIDFSDAVEEFGAEDMVFPGVDPIHRDVWGWGTGSTTTNINNVHTTVDFTTMSAGFGPDQGCGTTVDFSLELFSNNPTLLVEHSYLPAFPDVELTDMAIDAQLCGIKPTEDGQQIGFNGPQTTFRFDKNLNNFPDWFVELFVDVEAIIRNKVETKLENALSKDTSKAALTAAITKLVKHFGAQQAGAAWTDVEKFTKVRFDNGDLVVNYVAVGTPAPRPIVCTAIDITSATAVAAP